MKTGEEKNKGGRLAIAIVAVFLCVALASYFSPPISHGIMDSFSSLANAGNTIYRSFASWPDRFRSGEELAEENASLRERISTLVLDKLALENLKEENAVLRHELGLKPEGTYITASVIARPPQVYMDTLLINRGVHDGVAVGDKVLISDNVLIGKVAKVFGGSAVVELNSSAGLSHRASIRRTRGEVELVGRGSFGFSAKMPLDVDVEIDDEALLLAEKHFVLAVISAIDVNEQQGSQVLYFSWPVDIKQQNTVFVLKDEGLPE